MEIIESVGSIFDSGAEALVNPVNCQGIAGAGLALQFRERFPDNQASYKAACDRKLIKPGCDWWLWRDGKMPRVIINVATKDKWKEPSQFAWVESATERIASRLEESTIKTIAFPALGCGLGGLNWNDVRIMMLDVLEERKHVDVTVYLYGPQ